MHTATKTTLYYCVDFILFGFNSYIVLLVKRKYNGSLCLYVECGNASCILGTCTAGMICSGDFVRLCRTLYIVYIVWIVSMDVLCFLPVVHLEKY